MESYLLFLPPPRSFRGEIPFQSTGACREQLEDHGFASSEEEWLLPTRGQMTLQAQMTFSNNGTNGDLLFETEHADASTIFKCDQPNLLFLSDIPGPAEPEVLFFLHGRQTIAQYVSLALSLGQELFAQHYSATWEHLQGHSPRWYAHTTLARHMYIQLDAPTSRHHQMAIHISTRNAFVTGESISRPNAFLNPLCFLLPKPTSLGEENQLFQHQLFESWDLLPAYPNHSEVFPSEDGLGEDGNNGGLSLDTPLWVEPLFDQADASRIAFLHYGYECLTRRNGTESISRYEMSNIEQLMWGGARRYLESRENAWLPFAVLDQLGGSFFLSEEQDWFWNPQKGQLSSEEYHLSPQGSGQDVAFFIRYWLQRWCGQICTSSEQFQVVAPPPWQHRSAESSLESPKTMPQNEWNELIQDWNEVDLGVLQEQQIRFFQRLGWFVPDVSDSVTLHQQEHCLPFSHAFLALTQVAQSPSLTLDRAKQLCLQHRAFLSGNTDEGTVEFQFYELRCLAYIGSSLVVPQSPVLIQFPKFASRLEMNHAMESAYTEQFKKKVIELTGSVYRGTRQLAVLLNYALQRPRFAHYDDGLELRRFWWNQWYLRLFLYPRRLPFVRFVDPDTSFLLGDSLLGVHTLGEADCTEELREPIWISLPATGVLPLDVDSSLDSEQEA